MTFSQPRCDCLAKGTSYDTYRTRLRFYRMSPSFISRQRRACMAKSSKSSRFCDQLMVLVYRNMCVTIAPNDDDTIFTMIQVNAQYVEILRANEMQ
mmetsp:Transcript_10453/g.21066  ORF Transcript_10453/g.21066 Transcript_10453/m.21066 type:complete len:96 (-) Transcript_10453:224-511(-)